MSNIAAISTPSGIGGIAVIRVSGPQAIECVSSHFIPFRTDHALSSRPSHTLTFGQFYASPLAVEQFSADNTKRETCLDEVVVSLYRAPHSFTGEDVVEISCHGSIYIQQQILEALCNSKADTGNSTSNEGRPYIRLAEPGEFTRRAFANGRFDLSQAEAVADLISAQSAASHRIAMQQMKGCISLKLASLHDQLLHLNSLLVLELDFSEEDVEFADRSQLLALAQNIDNEVTRLASTFQAGQAIKNGIPVAIIGAPNVGKSTLLNALLKEDRAIVSDIQGTTRDLIEDTITLGGYLFRFIDTAGIRHTDDRIEQLGIERSHQAASRAQIILLMSEPGIDYPEIEHRNDQHIIYILNKVDTTGQAPVATLDFPVSHISISAKNGTGIDALENALIDCVRVKDSQSDVILTNLRHYEALQDAHSHLLRVIQDLSSHISADLVAEDLLSVIDSLNAILGRSITTQDTLNNIFKNFCIGK